MMKVGIVGWRGMVGSVLMQRMREENDFALIDPVFFTRPWVKKINYAWRPDLRISEYICEENNRNKPDASGRLRRH